MSDGGGGSAPAPVAQSRAALRGAGHGISVALLTGGDDRSYALGLTGSLADAGVLIDFIGSDKLDAPELHQRRGIRFLNLRGDQSEDAPFPHKVRRLLAYYARLLRYSATARPRILHILWNNKFEWFDRTALTAFYRLCGHRVVLTAHNVNAAKRDGRDTAMNRLTLRVQYQLADHVFVHTRRMKQELEQDFGLNGDKVSVIPFGLNDTVPRTALTRDEARHRLGLEPGARTALFFGQIAPYKGLEYLLEALPRAVAEGERIHLVVAGKVKKGYEGYWSMLQERLGRPDLRDHVSLRIEHIPDGEIEVYFKAADLLVLPYVHIFQSGVPFLGYSFGLPVVATDVGSLRDDVIEGVTGHVCRSQDADDLAAALRRYFRGELYGDLEAARERVARIARERYSWTRVAGITTDVYQQLARAE